MLYEKLNEETDGFKWKTDSLNQFDKLLNNMPQEAWIQ